ncbi:MAG: PaaI family thioesterase [Eubacteriales bacterium]|nr:PaaI family thioesterase [Eubacteriales bacterium]
MNKTQGNGQVLTEQEMLEKETAIQNSNPFCVHNYCEVVDVKKDYAEVRLKLVPESMNFRGTVHGGAYFTMADVCSGMVCRTDGRVYATQHASVEYVRAVSGGVLTGRGTVIHRGRTSCLVEVRITTEEDKLAFLGTFQFACIGG